MQDTQARRSALDLAEGGGLLAPDLVARCDSGDREEWDGVPCHRPNDDRRRPAIWADRSLTTVNPPSDGWASYGRAEAWEFVIRREAKCIALESMHSEWDRYEHLGNVPALVPRSDSAVRGAVAEHGRNAATSTAQLSWAEAHRGSALPAMQGTQHWMMDSGCGHDLVLSLIHI